eukprot:sb/3476528/
MLDTNHHFYDIGSKIVQKYMSNRVRIFLSCANPPFNSIFPVINLSFYSQHAAFKLRQETAKYHEEDNGMITAARKIAQKFQQMAKYTKCIQDIERQREKYGNRSLDLRSVRSPQFC